ncbi:hypothetical protein CsSME_00053436 [Camellia sinensis var. sinensis]
MKDEDLHQVDSVLDLASMSSTVSWIFGSDDVPSSSGDISTTSSSSARDSFGLVGRAVETGGGTTGAGGGVCGGFGESEVRGEEQQESDVGVHVGDREEERDGGRRRRRA